MPRELSQKPSAVRARLRKGSNNIERDLKMMFEKPVEEWDFEELQRGKPKREDGTFGKGPRPKWITPAIINQVRARLKEMTRDDLSRHVGAALSCLGELMSDETCDDNGRPNTPANVKLQAATYVLDQVIGKPTVMIESHTNSALEGMLARVMINEDGEDAHPIIEGTWSEVDEEGEDDE
jgi:hypothetical protein